MSRIKHWSTVQGDNLSFTVTFKNLNTSVSEMELIAKKYQDQETYDIFLYENKGITRLASNKYLINISPEITADLEPAWYFYQLKCKRGGVPTTPVQGKIIIKENLRDG